MSGLVCSECGGIMGMHEEWCTKRVKVKETVTRVKDHEVTGKVMKVIREVFTL